VRSLLKMGEDGAGLGVSEVPDDPAAPQFVRYAALNWTGIQMELAPKLLAYYLSKDRVLSLMNPASLPPHVLAALQGDNIPMVSALLSNAMGNYILPAISAGKVKTVGADRNLTHL
jgi:hypothetical protein